jgi:hypothetical protein
LTKYLFYDIISHKLKIGHFRPIAYSPVQEKAIMSSNSIVADEVLAAVRNFQNNLDAPSIQPAILANRNFDPQNVSEAWSGCLNDSWAPRIKAKTEEGFEVVRIQTEWQINGHCTMIYMVKMKS